MVVIAFCSQRRLSAQDPPTAGDLAQLPAAGPLSALAEEQIRQYIKHWVGKLKAAGEFAQMTEVKKKLVDGSRMQPDSAYYQVSYAKIAADEISVALSWPEESKQLLAAMAMASMPQYAIQPGLEKMASSSNSGVRYWAARGYRRVARVMMAYDDRAKIMLDTLEKLGLKEPSGATVGAVFRALRPFAEGISTPALAKMRSKLLVVWRARCVDVMRGKLDTIHAYRAEVRVLRSEGEDDEKAVLQMLADVMEAATRALGQEKNQQDAAVRVSLSGLLEDAEDRLVGLLRIDQMPIRDALHGPEQKTLDERMADLLDAVKTWVDRLADKQNIKPNIPPMPPEQMTTAPASSPASAPAKG